MSLSPNGALRFTPWTARKADGDVRRLHGVDERMRLSDFACALNTYKDLIKGFGQLGAAAGGAGGDRADSSISRGYEHSEL